MNDEFKKYFPWFTDMFKQPLTDFFKKDSIEYGIMSIFIDGWENRNIAEMLKDLSMQYGVKAGKTVEKFLELNIVKDWTEIGKKEGHTGTEIEDFIRILWGPNTPEQGFEFTINHEKGNTVFCVTKCPLFEFAEKTGLHDWLYHLACATDYFTSRGFSPKLGFSRTKTLIQRHDCCDHTYYRIE